MLFGCVRLITGASLLASSWSVIFIWISWSVVFIPSLAVTFAENEARVSKYITDNYGDTKFGSNEKTMNKLIKKSCSGLSVMKKIKNNKNQKYAEEQPKGFPLNLTYTQDGTQTVQNLLITKLKNYILVVLKG